MKEARREIEGYERRAREFEDAEKEGIVEEA
jgi:hypothetical protein